MAAREPAHAHAIPKEQRPLIGARLRLMRADGVACEGVVSGFDIVGRVVAPWGTLASWNGTAGEPPWEDHAIAAEAWRLSEKVLTARIEPIDGNCREAKWAHGADRAVPEAVVASPPTSAERRVALELFRQLPAYHQEQKRYASHDYKSPARWEDAGEAPPEIARWHVGGRDFITVQLNVTTGGCADFSGSLLAVYEMHVSGPRPRLTLLNDPTTLDMAELESATSIAGEPAFFYRIDFSERGILRGEQAFAPDDVLRAPYLACNC